MAEQNVITSMLDDLSRQQPISTALCIGKNLAEYSSEAVIQWHYFNVSTFLKQPFSQRYDLAVVFLDSRSGFESDFEAEDEAEAEAELSVQQKTQILVKLRDLMAKRVLVRCALGDTPLLRALGFSQLLAQNHEDRAAFWQFNILSYKQVPDWLNAKYWANPEHWNKFRW